MHKSARSEVHIYCYPSRRGPDRYLVQATLPDAELVLDRGRGDGPALVEPAAVLGDYASLADARAHHPDACLYVDYDGAEETLCSGSGAG